MALQKVINSFWQDVNAMLRESCLSGAAFHKVYQRCDPFLGHCADVTHLLLRALSFAARTHQTPAGQHSFVYHICVLLKPEDLSIPSTQLCAWLSGYALIATHA